MDDSPAVTSPYAFSICKTVESKGVVHQYVPRLDQVSKRKEVAITPAAKGQQELRVQTLTKRWSRKKQKIGQLAAKLQLR